MIAFITFIHLKLIIYTYIYMIVLDMWKTCHHLFFVCIVPSNSSAFVFLKTAGAWRWLYLWWSRVATQAAFPCCVCGGDFLAIWVFWWWQILPNVLRWLQLSEVCFLTRIIRAFNILYVCIYTQYIYLCVSIYFMDINTQFSEILPIKKRSLQLWSLYLRVSWKFWRRDG